MGETLLRVLEERALPVDHVAAFASRARTGGISFRGEELSVSSTSADALRGFDVVFFAGGEDASEQYVPFLTANGAVVIDNSATFRLRADVPLLVPEINGENVHAEQRLFPVGNCTAIILCAALAPVRDAAGLRSVRVATYQAVSGAGRAALDAFDRGESEVAENAVPRIGAIDPDGESGEEHKVREETRKILGLPNLAISALCVRVPVRTAHSEAVFFETEQETSVEELAAAFERAPGIVFHRDGIVTPREVEGTDDVHVARLRALGGNEYALWCVGDQLRKGAATNAVQILELLLAKGYVR